MGLKLNPNYGTHLPVLMRLMQITSGPVLELGVGIFSTPFLHWACAPTKRPLISYENDPVYLRMFEHFETDYHILTLAEDWDKINIDHYWDIVLVDHAPANRRSIEAMRLANYARYIVLHDTYWKMDHHYHYKEIFPLFKYRKDFDQWRPTDTTILSNFVDLESFHL